MKKTCVYIHFQHAIKWDLNALKTAFLGVCQLRIVSPFLPKKKLFNDVFLPCFMDIFNWNNNKHMCLKRSDSCSLNFSFPASTF